MSKSDALWYTFVVCYVAAAVCFFAAMVLLGYILAGVVGAINAIVVMVLTVSYYVVFSVQRGG